MRPLRLALAFGLASGALEVGLRAAPIYGMSTTDLGIWLVLAAALGAAFALVVGLLAAGLRRLRHGAPLGALLWVHAALAWRWHLVNAFPHEARVWAPILGFGLLAAGLAVALERPLARAPGPAIRGSLVLVALGAILGFLRAQAPAARGGTAQNNLVLITLDTARSDRFSAYGSANPTPAFDRLASGGALFELAISTAPLTEPSHLAMLTGEPPTATGLVSNGTDLGDRPALLPVALRAKGYATAGFVAGFPLSSRFGWGQGFDVYDDDFGAIAGMHRLSLVRLWDQLTLPATTLRERRADRVLARALPWLDAHKDQRFFLWIHLFDAHGPYEAPGHPLDGPTEGARLDLPPYWPARDRAITSTDWLIGAYEAEIRYVDQALGRLLDRLDSLDLADHTVVIAVADHGESLTEHGHLFDHGDDLYDPSLRVPMAIRAPGLPGGLKIPCEASNLDVTPTALGLLGVDDGIARQGQDRGPELRGGPCAETPVLATTVGARFVDAPPVDHALRTRDHKLIALAPRDAGEAAEYQLYDLQADPGELTPGPAEGSPLRTVLDAALERGGDVRQAESDEATRAALRALGYVQ